MDKPKATASNSTFHNMHRQMRQSLAERNEDRTAEYIDRFARHGIIVNAGSQHGDTHVGVSFSDCERLLTRLDSTAGAGQPIGRYPLGGAPDDDDSGPSAPWTP